MRRSIIRSLNSNSNLHRTATATATATSFLSSTSTSTSTINLYSIGSPTSSTRSFTPISRPFTSTSANFKFSIPSKSCPSCSTASSLQTLVCPECSHLLPIPNQMDLYSLMSMDWKQVPEGGWKVDTKELKTQWRKMMGVSHPDRMGGKSEKEQQIAEQQSSLINRAYETLLNPLQRAMYLLELHSVETVSETDSLEDPELLMQVMEFRERLEECESEDEAQGIRDENEEYLNSTFLNLSKAFSSNPPSLSDARKYTIELRYWYNIDKAAKEWESGKRVEMSH